MGPNVASGHSSVIFSSEAQINLIVGIVSALVQGATSVEVKIDAEKAFNAEIAGRLESTVWNGGCASWYKVGNKLVSTVRVFSLPPGALSDCLSLRTVAWNAV